MARQKKKESLYKVKVKILGRFVEVEVKKLEDVFKKLDVRNVRGMSIWRVEKSGQVVEKVLSAFITRKLLNTHGAMQEVFIKRFVLLFSKL